MSNPGVQEEQLLELMLQLKKTTPDSARMILNSQPQIAYALMAVMVNMNAVKVDVIQKTLADFTANSAAVAAAPAPMPPPGIPPVAVVPPPTRPMPPPEAPRAPNSVAPYGRGNTPAYPPRNGAGSAPPAGPSYYGRGGPAYPLAAPPTQPLYAAAQPGPQPGYGGPPAAPTGFQLPPAFANIPEDQKALLMKVVTMTPEEIHRKPLHERSSLIQLRQTLGLPI